MGGHLIEIEYRSLLNERQFKALKSFINKNAEDLGQDDKDVYFFLLPDRITKVVNNVSKKNSKIVAKLNRLGRGRSDFEEIEIDIAQKDFDKALKLFSSLNFDQIQNSYQKRHNYLYKEVEFALKHTESWGYHVELEIVIDDNSKKNAAEDKIFAVADELDIKIMSEEELYDFAKKIDSKYKNAKFSK